MEPAIRQFCKLLEHLVVSLMVRTEFADFRSPVDARMVPGYAEKVPDPMDLGTIRANIVARRYRYLEDFHHDLKLIVLASSSFNGPMHERTKRARHILRQADEFYRHHAMSLRKLQAAMVQEEVEALLAARKRAAARGTGVVATPAPTHATEQPYSSFGAASSAGYGAASAPATEAPAYELLGASNYAPEGDVSMGGAPAGAADAPFGGSEAAQAGGDASVADAFDGGVDDDDEFLVLDEGEL